MMVSFAHVLRRLILRKYLIEREVPRIGTLAQEQLRYTAAESNRALRLLAPDIRWVESFLTANRMFCIYLSEDESLIRLHAELSGFPITRIMEIDNVIDPTTAQWR